MEKNNALNKPIYKYKPISYYSEKINKNEDAEEEDEFNYIIDEQKINKLKAIKEQKIRGKNDNKLDIRNKSKQRKKLLTKDINKFYNNLSDKTDNKFEINALIDSNKNNYIKDNNEIKIKDNLNIKKSKSVHSLNDQNQFLFEEDLNILKFDLKNDNKAKKEKHLKNKKSKKKIKKIIVKKKNTKNEINNNLNEVNKKERMISEENSNNKNKFIIKIQSAWLSYKSKRILKIFRFIKRITNTIIKIKNDNIKYFFLNLKRNAKVNLVNVDNNKLNLLLKKEKNYDILKNKYEELLNELNELKNRLFFKKNLIMINNKNQNISINIFPKKENKRKNDLIIEKKNDIQILKENQNILNKTIINIFNLFYSLKLIFKLHLKNYFQKLLFYKNIIKVYNLNHKNSYNKDLFVIHKIKSVSFNRDNYKMKNDMNYNSQNYCIISNQICFNISNNFNSNPINSFKNLDIYKQNIIEIKNKKKNNLFIDKNEFSIKKEKYKKGINYGQVNYYIHKTKNYDIIKDEFEDYIINLFKKNNEFFEKIRKKFHLKKDFYNQNNLYINKILIKTIHKRKNFENIICKTDENNFSFKSKNKQNNYIITKTQNNLLIRNAQKKSNDFIITKIINNFIIKGINYSEETIDIFLFISDTYELSINSIKKSDKKNKFKINKVINDFIICYNSGKIKNKKNYVFETNKLIINKIINNMKITNSKKKEFIINKVSSNNILFNKNKNLNKKNIIINIQNKFYIKGNSKIKFENLLINKINHNYVMKRDTKLIQNEGSVVNNKKFIKNIIFENLMISKTENEFFQKIKKRKKLRKKKPKRFKSNILFLSDYNQLCIKKSKVNNYTDIKIKDNKNIKK